MKTIDFISPELYLSNYNNKKSTQLLSKDFYFYLPSKQERHFQSFLCEYVSKNIPPSIFGEKYQEDAGIINCDSTGILHFIQLLSLETQNYFEYDETIMGYTGVSSTNG